MQVVSTQKFVKSSPRKLRLVADAVRKMKPQEALDTLPFVEKRAALPIQKVIKTAVANARDLGMDENNLILESIQITEGPRLKRFRPISRGQAHGFVRQMSHIKVVVAEIKDVKTKVSEVENDKKMAPKAKDENKTEKTSKKGNKK